MNKSPCPPSLTYIYYTGNNDSVPHGPNCDKCMNRMFHEKKLDGITSFHVPTMKGVLTVSLTFLTDPTSPFTMKSIPEFMLNLECVSCARQEGYLQGIKSQKIPYLAQRIDCADEETILLDEDTPFDPISIKLETDTEFYHNIASSSHIHPMKVETPENGNFTNMELYNNSCYPQSFQHFDTDEHKLNVQGLMETSCMEDGSVPLQNGNYENIKQEIIVKPSSYFDHQMDDMSNETNNASTSESANQFKCNICNWETNVRRNLARHLKKHSRVVPFDCKFCGKGFVSTTEMKVHLQRKHNTAEPHYQCFLCELSLQNESELKEHMLSHANDVMDCSICLRRFYDENKLKEHYQTHNENKKFECHLCEKKFQHKRDMLRHVTRHHNSGTTKFKCELCDKSFSRNDGLRRHNILVHIEHELNLQQTNSKFEKEVLEKVA